MLPTWIALSEPVPSLYGEVAPVRDDVGFDNAQLVGRRGAAEDPRLASRPYER